MLSDEVIGEKVLNKYWNYSRQLYPAFNSTFAQFQQKLQPNASKLRILKDGIGLGVRSSEISESRIESAMRSMASQSKGKMPSSTHDFFRYLSDESVKINWIDAVSYVAVESTKDVIKGTAEVGSSIISAGKALNSILPIVLFTIAIIFTFSWLNRATGGDVGKLIKAIKR